MLIILKYFTSLYPEFTSSYMCVYFVDVRIIHREQLMEGHAKRRAEREYL